MNIGMITFHTPINYGAVLQAYALQQVYQKMGHNAEIIDYCTPKLEGNYKTIEFPRTLKSWLIFPLQVAHLGDKKRKTCKFIDFRKNNLVLTRRYSCTDDLVNNPPEYDVYSTGSDQVFNVRRPVDEKKVFFLGFTTQKKISYAASLGKSNISEQDVKEIGDYLCDFSWISIREQYGCDIVNKALSEKKAYKVVDPVFLITRKQWQSLGTQYRRKKIPAKYILLFALKRIKESYRYADQLSKNLGLPVVCITNHDVVHLKCRNVIIRDAGPTEFLYLMNGAECIITDSFHGVAFSIIMEKIFVLSDITDSNERALELLGMLQIRSRCYLQELKDPIPEQIDYSQVNQRLELAVNYSREYLELALAK